MWIKYDSTEQAPGNPTFISLDALNWHLSYRETATEEALQYAAFSLIAKRRTGDLMKKLQSVIFTLVFGTMANIALAQNYVLPPVTVTGQREYGGNGSIGGGSGSMSTRGEAAVRIRMRIAFKQAKQDVRCSALGGLNSVTSTADVTTKWLAAQSAFTTSQAPGIASDLKAALIGSIKHPSTGKTILTYTVTYADGGRESWMLTSNYKHSSIKLVDTPLPGATPGDGVAKPSPSCPSATLSSASLPRTARPASNDRRVTIPTSSRSR